VAKPGTGPRHFTRSADGALLLVGELAGNLTWYRPAADGSLARAGEIGTTTATKQNYPSEVTMGRDGRFVYVANRGADTIAAFAWDGQGVTPVAEVPTGGAWPRHMIRLGDHLYVANEKSHSVTTFRIDPATGTPVPQGEPTAEASPTALLRWTTMHS
jgi:6-phosphogluconolactonase